MARDGAMARWRDGVQILFAAIFYNGCCAFALFSVINRISRLHARLHRRSGYNSASLGAGDDDGGGHSHYNYAPLNETHHHHQRDASLVAAYSVRSSSASSAHPPGAAGGVALQQRPPSVDAGVQKLQVGARRGIGLASSRPFRWCSGGDGGRSSLAVCGAVVCVLPVWLLAAAEPGVAARDVPVDPARLPARGVDSLLLQPHVRRRRRRRRRVHGEPHPPGRSDVKEEMEKKR